MQASTRRNAARFWAAWGVWLLASLTAVAVMAGIAVVVVNSAVIVFREGLEAILILAAVTASMLGARKRLRRRVASRGPRRPPAPGVRSAR
jgi:hypothetical protein